MLRLAVVRGSPRRSGNSDYLMELFMGGVRAGALAGLEVRELRPNAMRIRPCQECGG